MHLGRVYRKLDIGSRKSRRSACRPRHNRLACLTATAAKRTLGCGSGAKSRGESGGVPVAAGIASLA